MVRDWRLVLQDALKLYTDYVIANGGDAAHLLDTPVRVSRAFEEYQAGYHASPVEALGRVFPAETSEMIHVRRIRINSMCAHHMQPIMGDVHFAYVPHEHIVGLSKIPRFIAVLSQRLQVQESLTAQIVDTFQAVIKPYGCAAVVRAYHCCMMARGVKEHEAYTETVALRGSFFADTATRAEFMASLDRGEFRL